MFPEHHKQCSYLHSEKEGEVVSQLQHLDRLFQPSFFSNCVLFVENELNRLDHVQSVHRNPSSMLVMLC